MKTGFNNANVRNSVENCTTCVFLFCRSAVLQYGMWDQIRVDHGREFFLTLFMQEKLADYRNNKERQPYLQTSSTHVSWLIVLFPLVTQLLADNTGVSVIALWYGQTPVRIASLLQLMGIRINQSKLFFSGRLLAISSANKDMCYLSS